MRFQYSHVAYGTRIFDQPVTEVIVGRRRAGRHVDVDLTPDIEVSRPHARLFYEQNTCWIEDLNSKHGTWVNRQRITEKTSVSPGTIIQMGQTTIKILNEKTPSPPTPQTPPSTTDDEETRPAGTAPFAITEPLSGTFKAVDQEGKISVRVDARQHPFAATTGTRPGTVDTLLATQLRALYNFDHALGSVSTLDHLQSLLLEHLPQALPRAQRGAVLLYDKQGKLVLKSSWPDEFPSLRMALAHRACNERMAFIWTATTSEQVSHHDEQAAIYGPLLCEGHVLGLVYVDNYENNRAFTIADCDLLRAIANQAAVAIKQQMQQRERQRETMIRSHLMRQFSEHTADNLLRERTRWQGSGRVAPTTLVISRIYDFATLSETMKPGETLQLLNDMEQSFTSLVLARNGVVVERRADTFLVAFGGMIADDDQWEKAILSAIEMQQTLQEIGDRWHVRGLPACTASIGIHTGEVHQGFLSGADHIEYTVFGHTVNQAMHYCRQAGKGEIVVSKEVYEHVSRMVEVHTRTIASDQEPEQEEVYLVTRIKNR